jgi:capsular polysaccharide biosynthesis protein
MALLKTRPPATEAEDGYEPGFAYDASASTSVLRVDPLDAARRHWAMVLLCTAVLGGAGAAIGIARTPTYTAQTTLAVSNIDVTTPGALAGFATSSSAFADSWSRSLRAQPVVSSIATQLHLPQNRVLDRISASAIPESPLLRVRAKGHGKAGTVRLANTAAAALAAYVANPQSLSTDKDKALRAARGAAQELSRAEVRANAAQAALGSDHSAAAERELADARATLKEMRLRFEARRTQYRTVSEAQVASPRPSVVVPARSAHSDRRSRFELLVVAGLVGGLALGFALAVMRAQRALRRRLG